MLQHHYVLYYVKGIGLAQCNQHILLAGIECISTLTGHCNCLMPVFHLCILTLYFNLNILILLTQASLHHLI